MAEWFETFFDGLYTKVLSKVFDSPQTLEQARMVKRLLGVRKGQRVLDVPCGKGRLTIPLAQMGLEMTGVDLTAAYLRKARRLAQRAGVAVRFVRSDMRSIDFDGEFHAAFNWFGSFGYFSDEDNLECLRRAFRALRPGGRFLVEGINKSWLLAHFRARAEQILGGVHIVYEHRWDAKTSCVSSTWTMSKGGKTERHHVRMRIFNGAEMRALLRTAGFRDVMLHPLPPVGRFTRHSLRFIAVARRPK